MEDQDFKVLVVGINRFSMDVYSQLWKTEGNVVFSPYSISAACAIAYAGARASTEEQIARTLHFDLGQETHSAFAGLETRFRTERRSTASLYMANALWFQGGNMPSEEYRALVADNYGAKIAVGKDRDSPTRIRKEMSRWIAKNTKGMIRDLLEGVNPLAALVIVATIHFRCQWERQFDLQNTRNELFHVNTSADMKVPMMTQMKSFLYAESDSLQILDLPYAGHQHSMLILLPREIDGLIGLPDLLSLETLQELWDLLEEREVIVTIPRFKTECRYELGPFLTALGLVDAFSREKADFSGISRQRPGLYIAQVIHESFIKLDEVGTEAAASTAIEFMTERIPARMHEPVVFRADHPFVFLITDRPTGTILFMGKISNPGSRGVAIS